MKEPEIVTLYRIIGGIEEPLRLISCQARKTPKGYKYVSGSAQAFFWRSYISEYEIGHAAWLSVQEAIDGAVDSWKKRVIYAEMQLERARQGLMAAQTLRQESSDAQ